METGTLHVEWFPAYGVRIKEMPHRTIIGVTEGDALMNLARLGFHERQDHNIDYTMVFLNEPFEIE